MSWNFNGTQAVFIQIADRLRRDIVNGVYPAGAQMPPVRQLAFDASVNPNTMQRALTLLESEGLVISRGTVGRYVSSDVAAIESARKRICAATVERFCIEARSLGMTSAEIIEHIKEVYTNE